MIVSPGSARVAEMRVLVVAEVPLAEIGRRFGVTRQRVLQLVGPTGRAPGRKPRRARNVKSKTG